MAEPQKVPDRLPANFDFSKPFVPDRLPADFDFDGAGASPKAPEQPGFLESAWKAFPLNPANLKAGAQEFLQRPESHRDMLEAMGVALKIRREKRDATPEEQAIIDRGMRANVQLPGGSIPAEAGPALEAGRQISEGNLSVAAGTLTGAYVAPAVIGAVLPKIPGAVRSTARAAQGVAAGVADAATSPAARDIVGIVSPRTKHAMDLAARVKRGVDAFKGKGQPSVPAPGNPAQFTATANAPAAAGAPGPVPVGLGLPVELLPTPPPPAPNVNPGTFTGTAARVPMAAPPPGPVPAGLGLPREIAPQTTAGASVAAVSPAVTAAEVAQMSPARFAKLPVSEQASIQAVADRINANLKPPAAPPPAAAPIREPPQTAPAAAPPEATVAEPQSPVAASPEPAVPAVPEPVARPVAASAKPYAQMTRPELIQAFGLPEAATSVEIGAKLAQEMQATAPLPETVVVEPPPLTQTQRSQAMEPLMRSVPKDIRDALPKGNYRAAMEGDAVAAESKGAAYEGAARANKTENLAKALGDAGITFDRLKSLPAAQLKATIQAAAEMIGEHPFSDVSIEQFMAEMGKARNVKPMVAPKVTPARPSRSRRAAGAR